jgi:peptidoglycan/LPS O-acetylase OafA/YrhL
MIQLDILRGIAILLVLFTHAVIQPDEAGSWRPVLSYLRYLGPSGVDLFFVLSGFLVGGLLLKEFHDKGQLDVRRFLIRRGFKIWPPYFVFLAAVFLWLTLIEHQSGGHSLRRLLPNLLHLQNYLGSPREHTWSLAVEEHFYVALPLLLLALTGSRARKTGSIALLPAVAVTVGLMCATARFFAYGRAHSYNLHYATHLRLDSLLFGVLLAYFYHFRPERLSFAREHRWKMLGLAVGLLLLYPAFLISDHDKRYVGSIGFAIMYVAYGAILLVLVHTPVDLGWIGWLLGGPIGRLFAFVGYFSYPIYLWHLDARWPIARLLRSHPMTGPWPEMRWLIAFLVYLLIALAAGVFFGILVDRQSLALRERFFPARTRVPTEQGQPDANDHPRSKI